MDLRSRSLVEWAEMVQRREVGARELVGHALDRIEALNPRLNAWAALDPEAALGAARAIDDRLAAGDSVGPLAGIPIGVKDLEDAAGFTTAYGSALHVDDPPATADSALVARLRAAGCVVVGKTTTPEHGFTGDTTSPHYGPTRNPWNTDRSPGGSSGGSPAAVASGMVPLATSSDGGGSIRIPSALCGLSGLKLSQGRVPAGGSQAPGSGLLSVKGPMVRKVRDLAYALDVCVGPDPHDPFSLPRTHGPWSEVLGDLGAPSKVIWAPTLGAEVDAEVAAVCEAAVRRLEAAGTEVITVDSVFRTDPILDWFVMWTAYREEAQGHLRGTPDWERITPALRDQMDYAQRSVGAVELTRAINSLYAHNADLVALLDRAPILLCPTVAGQTAEVGHEGTVNGVETPFWVAFTPAFNITRSPAGSVCAGYTADSMPVGLQIVGAQHADVAVLRTMAVIEDLLDLDPLAPID